MTQKEWLKVGSKWKTTSSKLYVLFPALDSIMGDISGKTILDAGCGDGVFVRRCNEKGAQAIGIDISPNAISACKEEDPNGDYRVVDIKDISMKEKFDYILSLFVLLSFDKKDEIVRAIKDMSKVLKKNGKLVIVVPHPAFEEVDNAATMKKTFPEGYSYSKKGIPVLYTHKTKKDVSFTDFHWMIEDYLGFIKKAGLVVEDIKEPLPIPESKAEDSKIYEERVKHPPMILFVCKKDSSKRPNRERNFL